MRVQSGSTELTLLPLRALLSREASWPSVGLGRWEERPLHDLGAGDV